MRGKSKIALLTALSLMLMPINIVSAADNIPNTSLSDTDKTSPCEVTADIHYAYYISLPATLTLEPYDETNVNSELMKKYLSWMPSEIETEEDKQDYLLFMSNLYMCNYQVKAKSISAGLSNKYIGIIPTTITDAGGDGGCVAYNSSMGKKVGAIAGDMLINTEGSDESALLVFQDSLLFGENKNFYVEKVDTNKWSVINGSACSSLLEQGQYKGNFQFVYGLFEEGSEEVENIKTAEMLHF